MIIKKTAFSPQKLKKQFDILKVYGKYKAKNRYVAKKTMD